MGSCLFFCTAPPPPLPPPTNQDTQVVVNTQVNPGPITVDLTTPISNVINVDAKFLEPIANAFRPFIKSTEDTFKGLLSGFQQSFAGIDVQRQEQQQALTGLGELLRRNMSLLMIGGGVLAVVLLFKKR